MPRRSWGQRPVENTGEPSAHVEKEVRSREKVVFGVPVGLALRTLPFLFPMRRFEHKTVLITGASRGIGKGLAKRFADEGASLVLASNEEAVHAVAEEFTAAGAPVLAVVCDVTRKAEVEGLFDQAVARFGQVDVSIHHHR